MVCTEQEREVWSLKGSTDWSSRKLNKLQLTKENPLNQLWSITFYTSLKELFDIFGNYSCLLFAFLPKVSLGTKTGWPVDKDWTKSEAPNLVFCKVWLF